MTTSHSPLSALKAQADKIAAILKAAERGENIDTRFAEKIETARTKNSFKVGIVMEDKIINMEISWAMIRETSEVKIAEYIVNYMRGTRE